MSVSVHLVDGTYELFRAYFAVPPATGSAGREVSATRTLARTLLRLLRVEGATHVGVAFDHVIESFRNELFDGYKTGEGVDEALRSQFELAERAARALGLVVWPMVEFEADDAIGTAAARFAASPDVERIFLCTPDKDLAQCVSGERVVLLDRRRGRLLDEDGVRSKFGVPPGSMPDFLALVGDSADGIPGVPRWGAKSASAVLAEYGRIEDVPDDASEWSVSVRGARSLAESLAARRAEALLYKRLATIRRDVPLGEELDDLMWRGATREDVERLAEELADDSLVEAVHAWQ